MTEDAIVWEGEVMFVTFTKRRYNVCVSGDTHAVIVGFTDDREKAIRCAERMDRYPANARRFAGMMA